MNSNASLSSKESDSPSDPDVVTAAIRIQRAWRRYIDMQVFKYYKDLVTFHNEGDPALIMRYINPLEAQLIDSASGIHIRFRLAGTQFPPTIFYKIFTHRPIQDICANAPRDYTKPWEKLKTAELVNNRSKKISFKNTRYEGWYQRIENNGWRPVSYKHLIQMNLDYYFGIERKRETTFFHHSKLKRRQEIELKKKRKKIEWMKKIYMNDSLVPKNESNDPSFESVKQSAKLLVENADSIDEWEVDELLKWTNNLDFNSYHHNWQRIGTTKSSAN